ncbi:MAG: hypothetical protein QOI12_3243 [Alphaproteobacteria bacterium]|jgi:subtilisin family serine protease|nr:hypothetical protein [Alphaproteobacteria bacterium]
MLWRERETSKGRLRIGAAIVLVLAAVAIGLGGTRNAAAVDDPKELIKQILKKKPAKAKPGDKKNIVAVPGAGQRRGPGGNAVLPNGELGNAPGGPGGPGALPANRFNGGHPKAAVTGPADGRAPFGKGPLGKAGDPRGALTKSGDPKGALGKAGDPKGATGSLAKATGAKGQFAKGNPALGPGARPGLGRAASMNPIERQRFEVGHRRDLMIARMRLPPRPFPGQRGFTGVPPIGETRFVTNEMMFQAGPNVSAQAVDTVARRFGLTVVGSQSSDLTGGTLYHFRYIGPRPVADIVRALEAENLGVAQPNYVYLAQQDLSATAPSEIGDPGQYVVSKLQLAAVHRIARGSNVLVAVIDSEIDAQHPDLAGQIVERFDAVGQRDRPDAHGTGMVGAIAAHRKLMGIAPGARILAVRAFSPESGASPQATTKHIIAGLEWAVRKGARVVNMSFAGPYDPMLQVAMKKAHDKGVVLIAAAGNAGPKSPPLYPAADPHVIAVTATDENDKLLAQAVRGPHVAVSAPGVDIMVPAPDSGYQLTTGTSVAAAHVSGVAALLIERHPGVDAATVLEVLTASAKKLNPKGRDDQFGWGLIDPTGALAELDARMAAKQVAGATSPAASKPAAAKPAASKSAPQPASISAR